jgi:hypothetical protein
MKTSRFAPLLFFVFFMSLSAISYADSVDNVIYTYDSAGNRISRTVVICVLPQLRSAHADTSSVEDQLNELKVILYPNPTRGAIQIGLSQYTKNEPISFMLFSPDGKKIMNASAASDLTTMDLSPFPSGWYILRVIKKDEELMFKIIKE